MHPVAGGRIGTPYRKQGSAWSLGYHTGVDYPAQEWVDIVAPASGYVARAGWDNSFGRFIIIRSRINGIDLNIYLCHMVKILVAVGQKVKIGQHVGEVGNTGNSYGSHCHLEVRNPPYGFNWNDIMDPKIAYLHTESSIVSTPTVFDAAEWNIARERWYTDWEARAPEIQRELREADPSIGFYQELFEDKAVNTIKAALSSHHFFSGKGGLEFSFNDSSTRWLYVAGENRYSGIANRHGQKITLRRRNTGQLVDFFNFHAPIKAEGDSAKAEYGSWGANWVKGAKNPVVIAGDFNIESYENSPKKEFYALGFRGFKAQAAVANEASKEFIPTSKDFCDILTQPSGPADITGGEVDVTTTAFESDHRMLRARIVVAPN